MQEGFKPYNLARDKIHIGCGGEIKKREALNGRYYCLKCQVELVCLKQYLGDLYEQTQENASAPFPVVSRIIMEKSLQQEKTTTNPSVSAASKHQPIPLRLRYLASELGLQVIRTWLSYTFKTQEMVPCFLCLKPIKDKFAFKTATFPPAKKAFVYYHVDCAEKNQHKVASQESTAQQQEITVR